jgi:hypothetical protein
MHELIGITTLSICHLFELLSYLLEFLLGLLQVVVVSLVH